MSSGPLSTKCASVDGDGGGRKGKGNEGNKETLKVARVGRINYSV